MRERGPVQAPALAGCADAKRTPAGKTSGGLWWTQSIQIRTAALRGSCGGHIFQRDGFEAILIVECNQNFFIIQINSIHECVDQRLTVAFDMRVQFAEPGQPESHEVRAEFGLGQLFLGDPSFQLLLLDLQSFQSFLGRAGQNTGLDGVKHILDAAGTSFNCFSKRGRTVFSCS